MDRKLASIQEIKEIHPIEDYDRVELAIVQGWQVIVMKDQFKVGDKAVYIEIDSVLPNWKEEFEFLRKRKFRIKTIKMCGVISQGICFSVDILPDGKTYKIGQDVTDILEIKKYDPQPQRMRQVNPNAKKYPKFLMKMNWFRKLVLKGKDFRGFPSFISKTDETRIQNYPLVLKRKDVEFIVREKIDGQSGTFFLKKNKKGLFRKVSYEFGVCSRNMRKWKEDDSSFWSVAKRYDIKNVLGSLIFDYDFIAIQGECIAPNVQGNKYKVDKPDFYVFNLITPHGKIECELGERILIKHGLKWCPIVERRFVLPDTVNELLDYATGESNLCDGVLREGLVFRNYEKQISFKAVSNEFLLKYGE